MRQTVADRDFSEDPFLRDAEIRRDGFLDVDHAVGPDLELDVVVAD